MPRIRIVGCVNGEPHYMDGRWLVYFDPIPHPDKDGGEFIDILTTAEPSDALIFKDAGEAMTYWMQTSGRIRVDGKPDRPLTAFHVEIQP